MSEALKEQAKFEAFLATRAGLDSGATVLSQILEMTTQEETAYLDDLVEQEIITPVEAANIWLGVHYK